MLNFLIGVSFTINIVLFIVIIIVYKYVKNIKKGGLFNEKNFDFDFWSNSTIFDNK
ncbi:MAG: hypothetical protein PHF21_04505 [Bacilli bacterium]|nr:hypothetical protein [Bacilli bacterium]